MSIVLGAGSATAAARLPHVSHVHRVARALPYALALAVALVLLVPVISLAFGYRVFVVTSGSMVPTARSGDAMLLRTVDPDEIRPGDVVTFRPLADGGVSTHRVMSVHDIEGAGLHFRTKGDANEDFDPNLVPASHVIGRVVTVVPGIGRHYLWATTPVGRLVLVGVPALLIIARELWWLFRPRWIARLRVSEGTRRRIATATIAAVAGTSIAGPSAARFVDAASMPSNAVSSGQVNAPTITGGSAQLIPCRVNLTWTAPATGLAPDGYDIYRATTSGGPYTFRKHVTGTSGSDDTGPLAALTTYHYVVRSTRSAWTSVNSNQRSVTTLLCVL